MNKDVQKKKLIAFEDDPKEYSYRLLRSVLIEARYVAQYHIKDQSQKDEAFSILTSKMHVQKRRAHMGIENNRIVTKEKFVIGCLLELTDQYIQCFYTWVHKSEEVHIKIEDKLLIEYEKAKKKIEDNQML